MDDNTSGGTQVGGVNPVINNDELAAYRNPLTFDLDDTTFLQYAKRLKKDDDTFWNEKGATGYDLQYRRDLNEKYLFGRQLNGKKMAKYASKAQDNILWESEAYLRAMAVSKLPDITVIPGNDDDQSKKLADNLSKIVTSDIQSRDRKRVLGLAFKHLPVYFTGVIKGFWNPQKGKYGDYDFKTVHPENVTLDYRAATNDVKDHDHLFETCEATVKELFMMFPEAKDNFTKELYKTNTFGRDADSKNENNEAGLNSKIKYQEVWFKWYDKPKDSEKDEWEEIIGVAWYYGDCLLKKIRHPYWDWSGTPQTFTYTYKEIDGKENSYSREKQPLDENSLRQSLVSGQPIDGQETETVFHNHLDYPEFPYMLMGMDQWGKTPLDETSRIEQSIPLQENYDIRQRQLSDIIDRSRGKHVFSSEEGLTKKDITEMDMADPNQDMLIKGDVTKMHAFIPGEQPSPALIQDAANSRERIFDKQGTHQATRGQVDADSTATSNQIAREGDFSRMDDLVDDTINYTAEKMANWIMQFIKLFYTDFHMRRILGPDGQWVTLKLHRDLLDDGMEVIISASGSDKLKAEQRAMDMAKMKLIDPFHFFKDVGASDPKGRTLALMTFLMQPDLYLQDIKAGGDGTGKTGMQSAAGMVQGAADGQIADPSQQQQPPQDPSQQGGQSPQAQQDIMQIQQGQIPAIPQQIDPNYAATFTAFMNSPQVEQLIQQYGDQFKEALLQFAQAIAQMAQGQAQQTVGPQPQTPPAMQGVHPGVVMGGGGQQTAGPLTQNPSPQNTSKISAIAGRG